MSVPHDPANPASLAVVDKELGLFEPACVTPNQAAALYRSDLLSAEEIVALADAWLENGLGSASPEVAVIALNKPATLSEVGPAFEAALLELGAAAPSVEVGVLARLHHYLRAIISGRVDGMRGMAAIDGLYDRRGGAMLTHPLDDPSDPANYLGRELGLQYLYIWYRELQDAEDGSTLFYFNDLSPERQKARFREELIAEARVLEAHLAREILQTDRPD